MNRSLEVEGLFGLVGWHVIKHECAFGLILNLLSSLLQNAQKMCSFLVVCIALLLSGSVHVPLRPCKIS